jgi:hypothetical protein
MACCDPDRNPCPEHWSRLAELIWRLADRKIARPAVSETALGGLRISFEPKERN